MLGLDSSKERDEDDDEDLNDMDLLDGLSQQDDPADTFDLLPEDLSSLLLSQAEIVNVNSSGLNTSDKELLEAMMNQDSSLAVPESLIDDDLVSDFPENELAELMMSQKMHQADKLSNLGEDDSISIGEATLAALETKEQIQNSQLSFDMHELKDLCASQMTDGVVAIIKPPADILPK